MLFLTQYHVGYNIKYQQHNDYFLHGGRIGCGTEPQEYIWQNLVYHKTRNKENNGKEPPSEFGKPIIDHNDIKKHSQSRTKEIEPCK